MSLKLHYLSSQVLQYEVDGFWANYNSYEVQAGPKKVASLIEKFSKKQNLSKAELQKAFNDVFIPNKRNDNDWDIESCW